MAHTNAKVSAKFIDKYGDEREIHHSKGRLMVKRQDNALFLTINPPICKIIGKRISELRKKKKMSLEQLCIKAGIASSTPKSRMWEIENNIRQHGVKLGTLYCIASALDVEITELLPTIEEVKSETGISLKTVKILSKA